jgi:hypothetical protein
MEAGDDGSCFCSRLQLHELPVLLAVLETGGG